MKFKYVREIEGTTMVYGSTMATGDVVEFEGRLAVKAESNPDLEVYVEPPAPPVVRGKKKRTMRST